MNETPPRTATAQHIGRLIRAAREHADITQADLASRINVSQPTISEWERGTRMPNSWHLFAIKVHLDIPDTTFIGWFTTEAGAA